MSPPALLGLWLLAAGLTALLPHVYTGHRMAVEIKEWEDQSHEFGKAVVKQWIRAVPLPPFLRGDEEPLVQGLREDPLLHAVVDPERQEIWIRDGLRLRPVCPPASEAERLLRWARQAKASGQASWIPPVEDHPDFRRVAVLGLAAGPWWEFKRWQPASPSVEQFLSRFQASEPFFKFSITRYDRDPAVGKMNTADVSPRSKARTSSELEPIFSNMFPDLSLAFGDPWVVGIWDTPTHALILEHRLRTWTAMAWSSQILFVTVLGLGCLLQLYMSRRDRLKADQLGFLAHSLKTPLTILKLRCDTIRNTSLSKDVQDTQVARIGDEVDKLVKVIEAGLEGVRPETRVSDLDLIEAPFFLRLQEQMEPIFAGEGRTLELDVAGVSFKAPARAVQPALNTLLENALMHGKGRVCIRAKRKGQGCELVVCDEGPGIPLEKITSLLAAGQDAEHRLPGLGKGVGIFLLRQMAAHEGWGLRFDTLGSEGFTAVLEIPA